MIADIPAPYIWAFVSIVGFVLIYIWWKRAVSPRLREMREYIERVSVCGYLPPPPTPRALRFLIRFAKFLLFIQVGKVRIIGKENLDTPGHKIITPNHPHFADPAVIVYALQRAARYMAAGGVFNFMKGLGSLLAGPCGAFYVDLRPGKGGPAKEAGIEVVTSGQILVMFPEGWAYVDGSMGPFKKGAVRIAREASSRLDGEPVNIVPVHLRYGKYPGAWLRKIGPPLEYFVLLLMAPFYRRGVTMVVGKPIPSSKLPADDGEATELLKQTIIDLDLRKKSSQS